MNQIVFNRNVHIDEFCDLTLEKFVETLQISKDSLKMPAVIEVK